MKNYLIIDHKKNYLIICIPICIPGLFENCLVEKKNNLQTFRHYNQGTSIGCSSNCCYV